MFNSVKLNAISRLIGVAEDLSALENDVLNLIGKVVGPVQVQDTFVPAKQPVSPTLDELLLARSEGKIPAIKAYRNRTFLGLKESKENIERAMEYILWTFGPSDTVYISHLFENVEVA